MNAPDDLLEYHATNESWFYLGPLEAGKRAAAEYSPPINERRSNERGIHPAIEMPTPVYVVESAHAWGSGGTPEIAWRYFLGSEFGPDGDGHGLDANVLRDELRRAQQEVDSQ